MRGLRGIGRSSATGFFVGAGAGGAIAILEMARSLIGVGTPIPASGLLGATLWYVGLFAAGGGLLGLLAVAFGAGSAGRAGRAVLGVAFFFVTAGFANVFWLPTFTSPVALAVDSVLLVLAFLFVRLLRRGGDDALRPAPWAAVAVVALALAVLLPGGSDRNPAVPSPKRLASSSRPVLFIVVDTLRADHTSLGGYARNTTPNLARFAEGALVFEQARSPSSWTKPAVASLLTGMPPAVHASEAKWVRLSPQAVTVAECLRAAGYDTALLSDNLFVSPHFGAAQGMDFVVDRLSGKGVEALGLPKESVLGHVFSEVLVDGLGVLGGRVREEIGAAEIDRRFLAWLDDRSDGSPWFAYLHYMEPHEPYGAPAPWDAKYLGRPQAGPLYPPEAGWAPFVDGEEVSSEKRQAFIDAYDGEIAYWDHEFGRLIEELEDRGALDRTLVVVTSDHGEGFYEHRVWDHRNSMYDELLHVPLAVRVPGGPVGRVPHAVTLESVPATILAAAGFEPPAGMTEEAGPLLPPPVEDRPCRARLKFYNFFVLSEVRDGWKWILSRRRKKDALQCFDLETDPGETTDLSADHPEEAERIVRTLVRRNEVQQSRSLATEQVKAAGDIDQLLKGLGYAK